MSYSLPLRNRLQLASLLLLLFAGAVGLMLELKQLANTQHFWSLVLVAVLVGAIAGGIIAFFLSKRVHLFEDKVKVYIISITLCVTAAPLLASLSNRLFASRVIRAYVFMEQRAIYSFRYGFLQDKSSTPPDHFKIWVVDAGELISFSLDKPLPQELERGDTILLWVREGLWGYSLVEQRAEEGDMN